MEQVSDGKTSRLVRNFDLNHMSEEEELQNIPTKTLNLTLNLHNEATSNTSTNLQAQTIARDQQEGRGVEELSLKLGLNSNSESMRGKETNQPKTGDFLYHFSKQGPYQPDSSGESVTRTFPVWALQMEGISTESDNGERVVDVTA